MYKKRLIILIFLIPEVQRIENSFCLLNFIIDVSRDIKKEIGINFVTILGKYSKVNLKYDVTEYPFSIIKSKKLTALAVQAIIDSANNIVKKDLKTSLKK